MSSRRIKQVGDGVRGVVRDIDTVDSIHASTNPGTSATQLIVYYDGGCPVCCWEVSAYSKLDRARRIHWIDIVALSESALPEGKTREDLLNRFHALDNNRSWHVGVDAFAVIWKHLPGFRRFSWLFVMPGIRYLAELAYRGFLKWQSWHRVRRSHPTS